MKSTTASAGATNKKREKAIVMTDVRFDIKVYFSSLFLLLCECKWKMEQEKTTNEVVWRNKLRAGRRKRLMWTVYTVTTTTTMMNDRRIWKTTRRTGVIVGDDSEGNNSNTNGKERIKRVWTSDASIHLALHKWPRPPVHFMRYGYCFLFPFYLFVSFASALCCLALSIVVHSTRTHTYASLDWPSSSSPLPTLLKYFFLIIIH